MKFVIAAIFVCACLSYSKAGEEVSKIGKARVILTKMSDKLKYSSQKAVTELKQVKSQLDAAVARHEMVKRNIESSYHINNVGNVPENCRDEVQSKLSELKNIALGDYTGCSATTIFDAVEDSVKIGVDSIQLVTQLIGYVGNMTDQFNGCFSQGIIHSISCTIQAIKNIGADIKASVDYVENSVRSMKILVSNITQIIDVCEQKQTFKTVFNVLDLCSHKSK